jgi:hypothetical protein
MEVVSWWLFGNICIGKQQLLLSKDCTTQFYYIHVGVPGLSEGHNCFKIRVYTLIFHATFSSSTHPPPSPHLRRRHFPSSTSSCSGTPPAAYRTGSGIPDHATIPRPPITPAVGSTEATNLRSKTASNPMPHTGLLQIDGNVKKRGGRRRAQPDLDSKKKIWFLSWFAFMFFFLTEPCQRAGSSHIASMFEDVIIPAMVVDRIGWFFLPLALHKF